ncbi:putative gTP cyclohydrolase 1 [Mycobacterium xenopi 3993]|nr:putative gTP cyclohydrolase 1 [Mycobacterium xenopi 3993]
MYAIGEDPDRHGLEDTPARVARTYREMFAGSTPIPTPC